MDRLINLPDDVEEITISFKNGMSTIYRESSVQSLSHTLSILMKGFQQGTDARNQDPPASKRTLRDLLEEQDDD